MKASEALSTEYRAPHGNGTRHHLTSDFLKACSQHSTPPPMETTLQTKGAAADSPVAEMCLHATWRWNGKSLRSGHSLQCLFVLRLIGGAQRCPEPSKISNLLIS